MDIDESLIQLGAHAEDAEQAIMLAGRLLVDASRVQPAYVEAMVRAYREIGPYIVIAPHIAMPHARPEDGALGEGIAILRLAEPVTFGHPENDPVRVVIPLAGVDASAHITVLRKLSTVLMAEESRTTILESEDPAVIANLFTTLPEG